MSDTTKHCVLLVEDNADDAQLALAALRGNRIVNEVVLARDGEEARDYLFGLGTHNGRNATGSLSKSIPLRERSISALLKRKYGL